MVDHALECRGCVCLDAVKSGRKNGRDREDISRKSCIASRLNSTSASDVSYVVVWVVYISGITSRYAY